MVLPLAKYGAQRVAQNRLSLTRCRPIRPVLMSVVFLTMAGIGCRQAPNVLLLGSTNDTRATGNQTTARWAEPVLAPGLPNLYRVSADLYRGAQPTAEGLQELRKLGIKTVVNLREANDEQARLTELGLAYHHIPMTAFSLDDDDVARFLRIIGQPGNAPVFVHCQRGADRTGLMCTVYRIALQGWTKDEALAEMTQGGFCFNRGYQNIVNYIQDLDVSRIRQRAGLTPALSPNPNQPVPSKREGSGPRIGGFSDSQSRSSTAIRFVPEERQACRLDHRQSSIIHHQFQTSGVLPGTATGGIGRGPKVYAGGVRSSFEAVMAQSHFRARPVYALIRPIMEVRLLSATRRPSFNR